LSNRQGEGQDKLSDIIARNKLTEKYETENKYLQANLKELKGIRSSRISYSRLMDNFMSFVSDSCCLTKIDVEDKDRETVSVELSGLAYTQSEVANIMNKIESIDRFSNVSLVYSEMLDDHEMKELAFRPGKINLINFKLVSEYHAD
jgi:hypothetical protein